MSIDSPLALVIPGLAAAVFSVVISVVEFTRRRRDHREQQRRTKKEATHQVKVVAADGSENIVYISQTADTQEAARVIADLLRKHSRGGMKANPG
jgi:hypothetical protein